MKSLTCTHGVKQVTCQQCPDMIHLAGGMYYSLGWNTRKQMHYYDNGKSFHGYIKPKKGESIWKACYRMEAKP